MVLVWKILTTLEIKIISFSYNSHVGWILIQLHCNHHKIAFYTKNIYDTDWEKVWFISLQITSLERHIFSGFCVLWYQTDCKVLCQHLTYLRPPNCTFHMYSLTYSSIKTLCLSHLLLDVRKTVSVVWNHQVIQTYQLCENH